MTFPIEHFRTLFLLILINCIGISEGHSQSDKERIAEHRDSSNKALYSNDVDKVLSFLTEDIFITTGNGNLISGKADLRKYISQGALEKSYWVRTTTDIVVNPERGLAWETGVWEGYHRDNPNEAFAGGNYSAMWTNQSGDWQIKSQLFVTLKE